MWLDNSRESSARLLAEFYSLEEKRILSSIPEPPLCTHKVKKYSLLISNISLLVCFDSLHPSQQFFSHVGTGLPCLGQY